jgi:hypothetical protein
MRGLPTRSTARTCSPSAQHSSDQPQSSCPSHANLLTRGWVGERALQHLVASTWADARPLTAQCHSPAAPAPRSASGCLCPGPHILCASLTRCPAGGAVRARAGGEGWGGTVISAQLSVYKQWMHTSSQKSILLPRRWCSRATAVSTLSPLPPARYLPQQQPCCHILTNQHISHI